MLHEAITATSDERDMPTDSPPATSIILDRTKDGRTRIECRFEDDSIWLTQAQIAELFQTTPQNVTLHLKSIYDEGELSEAATCKEHLQVRTEGDREVSRQLRHFRLEVILAVGYRVRSPRGTQFRQWATARLSEYLVKGSTVHHERLMNPTGPGHTDDSPSDPDTQVFFQTVRHIPRYAGPVSATIRLSR